MTTTAASRRVDAALVLMVLIWGVNYSLMKRTFAEIPPQPFNALRMVVSTSVFLAAIAWARRAARRGVAVPRIFYTDTPFTTADRWLLAGCGVVGHFIYQSVFVAGVAATSVSNSALIVGATPVVVAIVSAALGHERIGRLHWLGAATSAFGIYLVVGHGAALGGAHLKGDLLVMASVTCWAAYSLGAARLIQRHSPLFVTGMTFAIGCGPYVLVTLPQTLTLDWAGLPAWVFASAIGSALFALCLAYVIWYAGIQAIGVARTSLYSNLVPVAAMVFAAIWLGEPITLIKAAGTAAVLTGLFLTRLRNRPIAVPVEE